MNYVNKLRRKCCSWHINILNFAQRIDPQCSEILALSTLLFGRYSDSDM